MPSLAGCGRPPLTTGGRDAGGGGVDLTPPCVPWAPAAESWSTLPTRHPASVDRVGRLGRLRPSAMGKHLYTVAAWLEGGHGMRRILRSDDVGDSWCLVESPDAIVDVIPSPAQEAALYAVTTKGPSGQRTLLRTSDGGVTWTAAASAVPAEAIAPGQQPIVVGDDPGSLWFAGDTSANWHWSRDGGDSWKAVEVRAGSLVDPAMPSRIFAPGAGESAAQVTTDWGATWTPLPLPSFNSCTGGWTYACGFSVDASSVLYAGDAITTNIGLVTSVKVWASTNWGADWTEFPSPSSPFYGIPQTFGSHARGVVFAPSQAGLVGSEDGGRHWNRVQPTNATTSDLVALNGRALIRQAADGVEATSDGGGTWRPLPIVGAPTSLLASPVAPYPVWADNARVRSDDGGLNWSIPRSALAAATAAFADGADAQVAYATTSTQVMRTENGGASWEAVPSPTGHPITAVAVCPPPRSCLFVVDLTTGDELMFRSDDRGRTWGAPTRWTNWDTRSGVVISPDDVNHMLQGRSDAVYETSDGGQTWNYHPLGFAVVGLAFRSKDSAVAVTDTRLVLESADGGVTWTPAANQPPSGPARKLVQSTRRPRTLFIVTGDAGAPLLRSDDAGATWSSLPPLGDGVPGDVYSDPMIWDVVDLGDRFLAAVEGYGLVWFE